MGNTSLKIKKSWVFSARFQSLLWAVDLPEDVEAEFPALAVLMCGRLARRALWASLTCGCLLNLSTEMPLGISSQGQPVAQLPGSGTAPLNLT